MVHRVKSEYSINIDKLIEANTKLVDDQRLLKKDIYLLVRYILGYYVDSLYLENVINKYKNLNMVKTNKYDE